MAPSDGFEDDDVDVVDVDSDVDEYDIEDSKEKKTKKKKKKKKKKKPKVTNRSLSPSSRNSDHHEHAIDSDGEDDIISQASIGDDIGEDEIVPSAKTSLPLHDDDASDNDDTDLNPQSPKKKKKKKKGKAESEAKRKKSVSKKKKKKDKLGKRPQDGERRNEILLEQAMKRVSCPETENPAEIFLVGGEPGVGKSYWIESETHNIVLDMRQDEDEEEDASDDDRYDFFPVVCSGTCEIPPRIQSNPGDNNDMDANESSLTSNSTTESFYESGSGISRPPMHAIAEALNDLIRSLTTNDGSAVWKQRIEEALGITEASHLASTGLLPELINVLKIPGSRIKKPSPTWDWNSSYRFHRTCLAIRDLLRAVSESHHPVIMVLHDLHQADKDTYNLLNFLLTGFHSEEDQVQGTGNVESDEDQSLYQGDATEATAPPRLNNFMLIGTHDFNPNHQNDMLDSLERSFQRSQKLSFEQNQEELLNENEEDSKAELPEEHHSNPYLTKIHMKPFDRNKVKDILPSLIFQTTENEISDEQKTNNFRENLQELTEVIWEWTGGNIFYLSQVVELLKDEGAITSSPRCKLNLDEVKAQSQRWNKSIVGLMTDRIDLLPKVVRFAVINAAIFRQTYIEFSAQELFELLSAAYAEKGNKKKGEMEFPLQSASELESALDLASELGFMKRVLCRRNCDDSDYRWAFAHTIIRDEAYALFAKTKKRKKTEIHFKLGTKASALALETASSKQESSEQTRGSSNIEHNAFKILATDQLALAEKMLKEDCNKVALLFVETAQICIFKSAFHAAIQLLRAGIGMLERNGGCFTPDNHGLCVQMYISLARLYSVCNHGTNEADEAFRKVTENKKNLKDKIMLHQVEIGISIRQGNYRHALKKVLRALELLGMTFPHERQLSETISREIGNLRQQIEQKDNQSLLKPRHCTDKKTFDVMILLSEMVKISRLCKSRAYEVVSTIRMMKICLISGFTPQYSMSFAHYGGILIERSLATNDSEMAKEGYRMGQISEKMARPGSFYGGNSLAIFHHYVSHWRRPYRRSLGQILSIYNAQLESGDYFHIPFTTFTYVQYHLASGHNLSKLDDNLQLFDALYQDYKMENRWTIQLPQRLVSNLLDENSDPFILFGDTIEDQNLRIDQMEKAGENQAVQLMHFLILFNAIFFHNLELSKSCLEKISKENVISIWKPWIIFFQCFTDILSLPAIEKKTEKKILRETIDNQRDQLLDWYDQGVANCSFMVSLIDAELLVADTTGKKTLPSFRVQKFYDEAISVAEEQKLRHIEAFCLERASMRLEAVGADDLSAEYISRAHESYMEWNAISKVNDVEEKHASKLQLAKNASVKMVGENYVRQNQDMQYDPERVIGGGRKKIKTIDVVGVAKKAGKAFGKSSGKSPPVSPKGALKSPRTPSRRPKISISIRMGKNKS